MSPRKIARVWCAGSSESSAQALAFASEAWLWAPGSCADSGAPRGARRRCGWRRFARWRRCACTMSASCVSDVRQRCCSASRRLRSPRSCCVSRLFTACSETTRAIAASCAARKYATSATRPAILTSVIGPTGGKPRAAACGPGPGGEHCARALARSCSAAEALSPACCVARQSGRSSPTTVSEGAGVGSATPMTVGADDMARGGASSSLAQLGGEGGGESMASRAGGGGPGSCGAAGGGAEEP